jgi:hypothetical protein
MSYAPSAPQLRPLSVGEVLDASFKLYGRHFQTLVLCMVVVAVPLAILDTLVQASTTENAFNYSADADPDTDGAAVAGTIVSGLINNLILPAFATAACLRVLTEGYLGRSTTWQESLLFGLRRLWLVIAATILMTLAVIAGFIALVLPGFWLFVCFAVAIPALLFEELGPAQALGRSFRLVQGRWWATFAALFVMLVLLLVIVIVVTGTVVGAVLSNSDNEVLGAILTAIAAILVTALVYPLQAAVVTLIYFDLRVRKEGFDLQLLTERMGAEPAPQAGGVPPAEAQPGGFAPSAESPPAGGFLPPRAPGTEAPERPADGEEEPRGPAPP